MLCSLDVRGESLAYKEHRPAHSAFTLLLVHGNASSKDSWAWLTPHLDCHWLALDMRGFGASSLHAPALSIQEFALDLRAFI